MPRAVAVVLAALIGFVPIPRDPDLWFHLADGEYILTHGHVPQRDPFSFTRRDAPWVPHSWLFDVLAAASFRTSGARGAEAGMALVFAGAIAISFEILRRRGVPPMTALGLCGLVAIGAGNARGVRPQVFSLLFANIVLLWLVMHAERRRAWLPWALGLLLVIWAQFHSACVMGVLVVLLWWAGRTIEAVFARTIRELGAELRGLLLAAIVSAVAILATPHVMTHYQYVLLTMRLAYLHEHVEEWQAPAALAWELPDIYAYVLLAGVLALLARTARRAGWAETAVGGAMIVLALSGVRHIALAWIAAVPLAAARLGTQDSGAMRALPVGWRGRWATTIAVGGVLLAFWRYPCDAGARYLAVEPVRGTAALAELGRPLRVFTTYNTGAYVLWAGAGRLAVFVDSRADVYGDALLRRAEKAQQGVGWEATFEEFAVEVAVLERGDRLAGILRGATGWRVLAEDANALTFVRRAAAGMQNEECGDGSAE
ncbi:MAG: hypothetical protein CHACPFDD_02876 [Phycisphaerae bacterium]|nr:hypothetical protein [Phycisphaerae bacterium]